MIYKLIKQYASRYNFDDMVQSAHLGYAIALKTYKKDKSSLSTWIFINVRKCCQNQRNMEYQTKAHSETRKKMMPEELVKINENTLISSKTPYDYYLEENKETEVAMILALMSRHLTKLERRIFIDYYINNSTITQLRNKYHINNFDNLFVKFKEHLKGISKCLV